MDRATRSERTFDDAAALAKANGMEFRNPSDGCYQLRWGQHRGRLFIVNLYPRRQGGSSRAYHDPHYRGPYLALPKDWTLLDVVKSAVKEKQAK